MWFPRAVNDRQGGFDQDFTESWTNASHGERALVFQSRLTWLAARAAERFPEQKVLWCGYSSHGAGYLCRNMWDPRYGGFFWEVDRGTPARGGEKHAYRMAFASLQHSKRRRRCARKHAYGMAFAIYALAANFEATRDPGALAAAQNAFRWLDRHAHDARHGGYYEALARGGSPILSPSARGGTTDCIGTRYGYKSMNSHIHLLEAFTELHKVWPDRVVGARLKELFLIVRNRIVVSPPGAMNLFFRPDWTPVPDHDSFGQDIETAYLLGSRGRTPSSTPWANLGRGALAGGSYPRVWRGQRPRRIL